MGNRVLDVIIYLLEGVKENNVLVDSCNVANEKKIYNCKYLLNQTLRQYEINPNHIFISKKAEELWNKISSEPIEKYVYRNKVIVDENNEIEVAKFKGGENKPYEVVKLHQYDEFIYNDVFTDEHIVPINIIIKELIELDKLSYDNVLGVLDKIYICKMLKTEDKAIINRSVRSDDYKKVIDTDYKNAGIEVITLIKFYENRLSIAKQRYEKLLDGCAISNCVDN